MLKSLGKGLFKIAVLIGLILLVLKSLDPLFRETKITIWDHFYKQEVNSVDVLILGNSHINTGVDLELLEAKLKAKSVSLATKGQNIYQAYYAALEAYNYQVPEILIIENYLFYERLTMAEFVDLDPQKGDYLKRYLTFEGKAIGNVKMNESKEFFKGSIFENMFSVVKKHERWTDIDRLKNRILEKQDNRRHRGITILNESTVNQYESQTKFGLDEYNILRDEEEALNQIVKLAKQKGTKKVILLTVPFYKGYRDKINYGSLEIPLTEYAESNEFVDYVDLNKEFPNWDRTYFSNDPLGYNQHLNYKGAIKVSNYLANYISENHPLESNFSNNSIENILYTDIVNQLKPIESDSIIGFFRINNSKKNQVSIKQGESSVEIDGWMALKDLTATGIEIYIALVRDLDFIYINTANQITKRKRPDVTKNLNKENNFYDDSGFKININSLLLERGEYRIYSIIKNIDGEFSVKYFGKRVEII